jgi:hypothetical protein
MEAAADETIAACGGDAREAIKALIVANGLLREADRGAQRLWCRRNIRAAGMTCRTMARIGTI